MIKRPTGQGAERSRGAFATHREQRREATAAAVLPAIERTVGDPSRCDPKRPATLCAECMRILLDAEAVNGRA